MGRDISTDMAIISPPSRVSADANEALHRQSQRLHTFVLEVEEGEEQVVPGLGSDQHDLQGEDWLGKRQHDAPEDTQFTAAVNVGRVGQFVGDGAEELAQHEWMEKAILYLFHMLARLG